MNRQPLHIFLQSKGGVGKSVSAYMLAQYLQDRVGADNCTFIDTDPKNSTFANFKALNVAYFNATHRNENTGETRIDTMEMNAIFEEIMVRPQAIVVDTGSSNYIDLKSYLEANGILDIFNDVEEVKRDVVIHVPVNGGADFPVCIDELGHLFSGFKAAKFVVWLNRYGGKLQTSSGKIFADTKIASMLEGSGRFLGVVEYPELPDLQFQTLRRVLSESLTFKEVLENADGSFNILTRTAIERVRNAIYHELDEVLHLN